MAARRGVRVAKWMASGAVLEADHAALERISEDEDIEAVTSDLPVRAQMATANVATGADQAWAGIDGLSGYTGRGVGVAIIDSGITLHNDIRGKVIAAVDFTDKSGLGLDGYGHGTHIAGIVAGGRGSGGFHGVAPGAHLINLKVIGASGQGYTSDVIEAIDWAIANRKLYNIRVLNLSFGHPVTTSYTDDPMVAAVERAVAADIVCVTSAGNLGRTAEGQAVIGGIVSPGNAPSAITVGASNARGTAARSDDVMATYSSRGPTYKDGLLKPDLVAPGNKLISLAARGATLVRDFPERKIESGFSDYFEMSGTSMAAGVVSGAAALLLEANPGLQPAQVKFLMQVTAGRLAGAGLIEQGAGELNVASALMVATGRAQGQLPVVANRRRGNRSLRNRLQHQSQ